MVTNDPATLRLYADVFAKPRRDPVNGVLHLASEFCVAAALALRERANRIEAERRVPDAPPIDVGQ